MEMPNQTVTRTVECNLEPLAIFGVLADPRNIPVWAPVFADTVERVDDTHYRVVKGAQSFNLDIFLHPSARAVGYVREMRGNKRGGAYIRVMPRPRGGSSIAMTVPVGSNANEVDVAKTLEQELASLIELAQK